MSLVDELNNFWAYELPNIKAALRPFDDTRFLQDTGKISTKIGGWDGKVKSSPTLPCF